MEFLPLCWILRFLRWLHPKFLRSFTFGLVHRVKCISFSFLGSESRLCLIRCNQTVHPISFLWHRSATWIWSGLLCQALSRILNSIARTRLLFLLLVFGLSAKSRINYLRFQGKCPLRSCHTFLGKLMSSILLLLRNPMSFLLLAQKLQNKRSKTQTFIWKRTLFH